MTVQAPALEDTVRRPCNYNAKNFKVLESDIKNILQDSNLTTTSDCLEYIRNNTNFNGNRSLCIDLVKFKGINRYARFVEVFTSFMHIIELCKEDNMHDTLDNLVTVALGKKHIAVILLTILGSDTFESLLHVNRDLHNAHTVLTEISTVTHIDEMFDT